MSEKPPVDAAFTVVSDAFNWRTDAIVIALGVAGFIGAGWMGVAAMERGGSAAFSHGLAGACAVAIIGSVRSLIAGHRHRRQQATNDTGRLLQLGHDTSDRL